MTVSKLGHEDAPVALKPTPGETKVDSLVDWVCRDIRRRGLQPGDRYMTSQEAARLLEVSTGTAHEAMRVLVGKNVLDRQRKRGTFIGDAVKPLDTIQRPRVYVLSPPEGSRDPVYSRFSEAFYPAISQELGGAAMQLEFLPEGDAMSFVRALAEEAGDRGDLGGFLLIRPSYELQEYFHEERTRLPAVVLGRVYPGITELPWVDADQHQMAKLTAEYVLRHQYQRVVVLRHDHWASGDNTFMSGLVETFETSGQRLEKLEICSLPPYERPVRQRVQELFGADQRPRAIVVHTSLQASLVLEMAKQQGLDVPGDVDVIKGGLGFGSPYAMSIPHAASELSMAEIGATLGRMFASLSKGQSPEPKQFMFPVRFQEMDSYSATTCP